MATETDGLTPTATFQPETEALAESGIIIAKYDEDEPGYYYVATDRNGVELLRGWFQGLRQFEEQLLTIVNA